MSISQVGITGMTPLGFCMREGLGMAHKEDVAVATTTSPHTEELALASLVSLLTLGRGQFTLAFVYYERPGQRKRIIARLQHALADWRLAEVSLQDPALDLRNLSGQVFDTLRNIAQQHAARQPYDAVFLLDWEQRMAPDQPLERQPSTSLLGVFNMGRHLLEQAFSCPFVVFVPQHAMATLLRLAPDFVSWQSGAFFVPFDVAAVAAEMRTTVETARTVQRKDTVAVLDVVEQLEVCLNDAKGQEESAFPTDLIAEALAHAGELHLTLGHVARAEMLFEQLEHWAQKHNASQWQRRARRGRRAARRKRQPLFSRASITVPWHIFQGAAAFTDEASIYGREEDLRQLLAVLLHPNFRFGTLWGETGCGKTSLVQAGLIPALRRQGYLPVYVNRYVDPEADVSSAVSAAAELVEPTRSLSAALLNASQTVDKTIFLLCDQFEQVFTQPTTRNRQQREPFLHSLAECMKYSVPHIRCLLLVRADHLYHLTEFDNLAGVWNPLALPHRYELRWLRRADAARVLINMKERVQAVWPEELIDAVVDDLASDDLVKPVQIQLAVAGLYLRQINTLAAYNEVGRVEGLLQDYLTAVFDTLSQPALARHVVWSLVLPGNPPVRLLRSAEDIAREVHVPDVKEVQTVLDELTLPQIVHARTDTSPVTFELVHDVLVEPALRAMTAQEQGLSIIRSALAQKRWRLHRREYRAAKRSDITELPPPQQAAARQLLRWTLSTQFGLNIAAVFLVLFLLIMVLQHTAAHIRIKAYPPEPLLVHRGLQRLDFLPGFLGPTPLFDTGLTVEDIPSNHRSSVEAMTLRPWDAPTIARMRQLFEYLYPESAARWWFYAGDWAAGSQAISSMTEKDRPTVLEMAAHIVSEEAIPSLLTFVITDKPSRVRGAALLVLGQIGQKWVADIVPALLPLLRDSEWEIRQAAGRALGQIGQEQAGRIVPALLPLLQDSDQDVRQAAAGALGQIGQEQADRVVPALLPLLQDPVWNVRQAAAGALGQIGQEQADRVIPALLPLLQDPRQGVRQAIADALAKNWVFLARQEHGKPVYRKLASQLSSRDSQRDARYRLATVQALALWYNAGRPREEARGNPATAQHHDAPESTASQAQREHAELQTELERTCYHEPHLWLRSAACQVWTEAYRLRALP
jgi:hypothetical protein